MKHIAIFKQPFFDMVLNGEKTIESRWSMNKIAPSPELVEDIRIEYGKQIGTDRFENWESTLQKKYCTLIWLEDVKPLNQPLEVPRSNGAGWIILKD